MYFGYKFNNNVFARNYEIPLGYNTWKGNVKKSKIVSIKVTGFLALGIISTSRYGKSVLLKRIYCYPLGLFPERRCGVVFDMQGDDHNLSRKKNSKPSPLFKDQGEEAIALDKIVSFTPCFVKDEKQKQDSLFAFSICDCDLRDLNSLQLSAPAVASLYRILVSNKVDTLKELRKEVQLLEHAGLKSTIERNINLFEIDDVFRPKSDRYYKSSFINELKEGKIIVVNFHQSQEYAPLYMGLIIKNLYSAVKQDQRNKRFQIPSPVIVVEEADLALPRSDRENALGSNKWLMECLRRGGKYNFNTILSTQQASNLNSQIKNHIQQWILGNLVADDIKFFSTFLSSEIMRTVDGLNRTKNKWGAREWVIAYDNHNFDTFVPLNSPVEIHRQSTQR